MVQLLRSIKSLPHSLRFIDYMSPRKFYRLAIALMLIALVFCVLSPSLFYGFDNVWGSDELRLFNKGKGLAFNTVDLYHTWDRLDAFEVYPPGYSMIVAEILLMFPGIDPFGVEYIYKTLFFGLAIFLYFWLGMFFSRKVALAAVVIRCCIFVVMVTRSTFYTYLIPYDFLIGGGNYTEIAILLTLIFILRFLNHLGSDKINLAMILIAGLLHGLTHISGFTAFTVFLVVFLIIYTALLSTREARFGTSSPSGVLSHSFNFLKATFNNRVMMPVYITILLPLLILILHYLKIIIEASSKIYRIDELMPLPIPMTAYVFLMAVLAFFGVIGLLMGGRKITISKSLPSFALSTRIWRVMILMYIASFLLIMVLVNGNPDKYAYAIYAVTSGFTSYLPGLSMGLVPILTVVAGTAMFIISVIGVIGLGYKGKPNAAFLAFFYLVSYWFFTMTFVLDVLIPHRTLFFLIPLSLVATYAIVELPSSLEKLMIVAGLRSGRISMKAFRFIKANHRKIAAIIIVGFLAIGIVARANFEPIVRDYDAKNILQFGATSTPIVTTDLIRKLQEVVTPGESILCPPDTLTAIYSFVDVNPFSSPSWNVFMYNNTDFSKVFYSMNYQYGHTPTDWLLKHNGTLIVFGLADVKDGVKDYAFYRFNTSKQDNDPNLIKLYESDFGELIYKLNVTAGISRGSF